jgi:RHS repeat-associated protein
MHPWQTAVSQWQFRLNVAVADACRHVTLLMLVFLVCAACSRVLAGGTTPNDWVEQTKSYDYWVSLDSLGLPPGSTITGTLESDEFPFTLTPGNYEVTVNLAWFDDKGTIGSLSSTGPHTSCGWGNEIANTIVPADDISISPDGKHLQVQVTATDDADCGGYIGWSFGTDLSITWKARCSSCADSCASAASTYDNSCVHVTFGLGKDAYQQNAGQLVIQVISPSVALAKPDSLQVFLGKTAERINDTAGVVRQIHTSQLLADIVVSNDFCYALNFYTPANFNTTKDNNGLYQIIGQPFKTVIVENPDASTTTFNRLRFVESGDFGDHQYDYEWDATAQQWDLTSGGGLRTETRTEGWDETQTILTETNEVINADSTVAFKQVETYEAFPWGETNLVQRIVDPDGSRPQTNTWEYYDDALTDGDNYTHLMRITQPGGYWERYEYDSLARMIKKVAQFGDAAINAPESQCRVTTYSYSSGDNQSQMNTVETLLGQEVGRSYRVNLPASTRQVVCQTPGADLNASDNLVSITTSVADGAFQGQTSMIQNPDGTVNVYQYSTNSTSKTTTVWSGAPDSTGTNVVDGTMTVSVLDLGGNSISNATYDIASGLLLSSAVTLQTDALGRPTVIQYNDGSTMTTQYGCCGIDSQTDRNGITTSYTYDELKRVSTITRAGITTSYTYDANGRILTTTRKGTDNSTILQNTSVYDVAGRLISSTNALNYGTTYTETNDIYGHTVKTTINPDNSTRIETYAQDGSLLSVTGTAVLPVRYEYGVEIPLGESVYRAHTKEIKLNTDGSDTSEWTKTYTDMTGRAYKSISASATSHPTSRSFYNGVGQLVEQVDPDGVTALYQYNAKGQVAYTAVDMNTNGIIDFDGTDRITYTVSDVINDNGVNVNRTRTFVWATNNLDASNLVSTVETSVNGLRAWNIIWHNGVGLTNYSQTVRDPANARTVVTSIGPDGSYSVTTNQNGQLISATRYDALNNQLSSLNYAYDAHGRQNTMTDARNGTTTSFFNDADQIVAAATPSPDGIQTSQVTTNILDSMGRVIQTILPDNTSVTNLYYPNGLLEETYGSRTYPVAYTYDYAGRMKTMTTWTNFVMSSGAAITTWNYDPYRGLLTGKTYADGKGPAYYYTQAGRLMNRLWARGILTTYSYDTAGTLKGVAYSDSTPGVTYGFDRLGRQVAVTNGATVCSRLYDDVGDLLIESYTGGPLNGLSMTNGYDALIRRTMLSALSANSQLLSTIYTYDAASRLSTVSDGTNSATYTYVANSPLVNQIAFQQNSTTRMTTTKTYDFLNRLTAIQSSAGVSPDASFNYNYNSANQRTTATNADNSYWVYQYDSLGQVISGKKYWTDGTPVAGQQFTYNFDDIGNRKTTASGGDQSGAGLRPAFYSANNLNQYTSRDVPGYVNVLGSANSNATVTVNLQRAYRYGNYFQDELGVNNSSSALWLSLTNLAVLNNGTNADIVAMNMGKVFVSQTPETFGYDADGNMTNDGRFTCAWDAENRLINLTSLAGAPTGSKVKLDFAYDYQGRRIQKTVSFWNAATLNYQPSTTNRFVYDGWNLIAILNPQSSILQSFVWGTDLSGSPQGAGGVGGLLWVNDSATINNQLSTHFYAYDGNGNIVALINANDGTISANYEYDPFGQTIRATGVMAKADPIRFSTKYQDDESDLLYHGYRYYKLSTGTWPNRDPIAESGGLNAYSFVYSDPINRTDQLGLSDNSTAPIIPGFNPVLPMGFQPPPLTGFGQPPAPIPVPPGAPPSNSPGTPGNTAQGVAGAVGLAANLLLPALEQSTLNQYLDQGLKNCIAQAKKNNGCCGCCMIRLYLLTGKYGEDNSRRIVYNSSQFFTKPCFAVQADLASMSGPSLEPDYRRYEFNFPNWLIHHINGNPNLYARIPMEDQTPIPQFLGICTK